MTKRIVLVFLFSISLLLSGCTDLENEENLVEEVVIDYTLFDKTVTNYSESETVDEELYAVYYYDSTDENSDDLYAYFLSMYSEFYTFNLYVLDTLDVEDDSLFGGYDGTPLIYLFKDDELYNTYTGSEEIEEFFMEYLELDYDLFPDHIKTSAADSLQLSDGTYIEYYYGEYCSHCRTVKPDLLYLFFMNSDLEFYLFNTTQMDGSVTIPGFLGTPTVYIVKNHEVVASYVGSIEVMEFIEDYNEGLIDLE